MIIPTSSGVSSVAFSHDGIRIVSGSYGYSVQLWDAATGDKLRKLDGHTDWVSSVAFSHDETRIVSGSNDTTVRVWDAKSGEQLRQLNGHTDWVRSVAFSHDGTCIVSGSGDMSVRVWDAESGKELRKLDGHIGGVHSVALSHDRTRIVSRSDDESSSGESASDHESSNDNCLRICGNSINDIPSLVKSTGWVISGSPTSERLMWISPNLRPLLHPTHSILIIWRKGSIKVSFEDCKLGTEWAQCYSSQSVGNCD